MGSKDKLIPFIIPSDTSLVVAIHSGTKAPSCVSELACEATQKHGITELSMDDHVLEQKMQARWQSFTSNNTFHIMFFMLLFGRMTARSHSAIL